MTFEQAMTKLEQITARLESGELPLEDSLTLFEEGVTLSRFCSKALEEAEQKIAVLTENEEGKMTAHRFSPEGVEHE